VAELKARQEAVVADAVAVLAESPEWQRMAQVRGLQTEEMSSQVALHAVRTILSDLTLGTDLGMRENLEWFGRLDKGHRLEAKPSMYEEMFKAVFDRMEAALDEPALRDELRAYRAVVERLIPRTE